MVYPPLTYTYLGFRGNVSNISELKGISVLLKNANVELRQTIACLYVEHVLQPLEGKNGYLFLDNDTNKSVDQFTGRALLQEQHLAKWLKIFSAS